MAETQHEGRLHHQQAERLTHALYGLIIVTATLVVEQGHVDDAGTALALLLSTGLVLFLAHGYAAAMATRAVKGHSLTVADRRLVLADNLPVLLAIVVPALLFLLAWIEVVDLSNAYTLAIGWCLVALFGLGVIEARIATLSRTRSILAGLGATVIGVLVIALEAFFD